MTVVRDPSSTSSIYGYKHCIIGTVFDFDAYIPVEEVSPTGFFVEAKISARATGLAWVVARYHGHAHSKIHDVIISVNFSFFKILVF